MDVMSTAMGHLVLTRKDREFLILVLPSKDTLILQARTRSSKYPQGIRVLPSLAKGINLSDQILFRRDGFRLPLNEWENVYVEVWLPRKAKTSELRFRVTAPKHIVVLRWEALVKSDPGLAFFLSQQYPKEHDLEKGLVVF